MKRPLSLILAALLPLMAAAYSLTPRVSVHDPSVVWDPETKAYYIFGSHRDHATSTDLMQWNKITVNWQTASSTNADNAQAFTTPQVTQVKKGGIAYDYNFNAYAWSAKGSGYYSVDNNMWAPDVIYNKKMGKWCMYLSINGDNWYASIILLTADKITGPYRYQAPVVAGGFRAGTGTDYKSTDLEIVLGTQSSLPSRYNTSSWGNRYPNCIDPCVFYDEDDKLWMAYGSWSGGIWMLELNEETGLRDYDVEYPLRGSGDNITVDPYFGKKIAGGYYVSGEASYIRNINGYYFLFLTYGGLAAGGNAADYNNGGYQMRVFRSEKPDGPYVDTQGVSAIYNSYLLNFGARANSNRGVNLFGAYTNWGHQAKDNYGERSQGHNSVICAEDGRTYLAYHTRFQNLGDVHQVRVHQLFQNDANWPVAAPFEYTGETVKSADIATTQQIATNDIPGYYKLLIHRYQLDHTAKEIISPVEIKLLKDGSITGDATGTWSITEGTSYINIQLSGVSYSGVMVTQTMEPTTDQVPSFTALAASGVTIWGYRYQGLSTSDEPSITDADGDWKVVYDFSSMTGLSIVGDGSIVSDATFGQAFQNGGGAKRSHYLLLPSDVLSHSGTSREMTIAFWVNAVNAGGIATYTYAPLFTAYANAPGTVNTFPMMALQSRGLVQVNCNGWCDFTGTDHVSGKVNIYNETAKEASDAAYNFVDNWLDDNQWHYYTVTFTADHVIVYLDGEVKNEWTLNGTEGHTVNGLFSNSSVLTYICLGGNQAWEWNDNDAQFLFAKVLLQNKVLTQAEIKAQMQIDATTGITTITQHPTPTNQIYNLQGQRIAHPQRGTIYIQNGKKILWR